MVLHTTDCAEVGTVAHLALVAEEGACMTTAEALRVAKRRPGVSGGSAVGSGPPRCAVSPAHRPGMKMSKLSKPSRPSGI